MVNVPRGPNHRIFPKWKSDCSLNKRVLLSKLGKRSKTRKYFFLKTLGKKGQFFFPRWRPIFRVSYPWGCIPGPPLFRMCASINFLWVHLGPLKPMFFNRVFNLGLKKLLFKPWAATHKKIIDAHIKQRAKRGVSSSFR